MLGALACLSFSLDSVFLANTAAAAVCALPVFKSLRRCDFDDQQQLNLSALQALPSLEELYVSDGTYSSVPSAGKLTSLWVQDANVDFSRASTTDVSLKSLVMYSCKLSRLHDSGLTVCKALTCLEINNAVFTAALRYCDLQVGANDAASIPAKMSELTCLTKLDLVLASRLEDPFDLNWVDDIVTLKHLELKVQGSFTVSEQLLS